LRARCNLLRARCSLLKARCSLLKARCSLLRARCSLLGARCSLLKARCSLLRARCNPLKARCSPRKTHCSLLTRAFAQDQGRIIIVSTSPMKSSPVGQEIYHQDTKSSSFFVLTLCLGGEKPVSFLFRLVRVRRYAVRRNVAHDAILCYARAPWCIADFSRRRSARCHLAPHPRAGGTEGSEVEGSLVRHQDPERIYASLY
jgi:hypothetical protein